MATLRTDSPISRSIVRSFLQFLSSVEAAPGADTEGLEVAAQCLSEVFGLTIAEKDDQIRPLPLVDLFTSQLAPTDLPESSARCNASGADRAAPPMDVSSHLAAGSSVQRSCEPSLADLGTSSGDTLLEQFREGLELAGYFDGTMQNTPEYAERLNQAKHTLEDALKRVRSFAVAPKWSAAYSEDTLALAEAFKVQGNTTMSALRYHDAIQLYTLAISLCSNNAIFYSNRAAALTQVGKYDEAIADCEVAIKLDPQYSKAYSRLGLVYFALGRLQDAIDRGFKKALELDPSSTSVKENLQAAQQKLEEQQRPRQHQEPPYSSETQNSGTFTASSGPINMPLPPEIANLLPGIFNLAAQFGHRAAEETQQQGPNDGAAEGGNHTSGGVNFSNGEANSGNVQVNPEGTFDGHFNITFDGQQLPPGYSGLMQSAFQQMFGAAQGHTVWPPGSNPNPNPQSNPPEGS